MKFKTSEEIRKEKEAREKNSHKDEKLKDKAYEKAQRKYAAMMEASAKREASRPVKPKITVLPGVIIAPALLEMKKTQGTVTGRLSSKGPSISNAPKERKVVRPNASQVWDDATKQWVKR